VTTGRWRFVRDARQRPVTFTELCAPYGLSPFTGRKWLGHANQSGVDFLQELSRRPPHCPHPTAAALTARLLEPRPHHPSRGPRKLLALVHRQDRRRGADHPWPARSTVAEYPAMQRPDSPRRRRAQRSHPGRHLTPTIASNVLRDFATEAQAHSRTTFAESGMSGPLAFVIGLAARLCPRSTMPHGLERPLSLFRTLIIRRRVAASSTSHDLMERVP
jgi:hypothetical protein